MKKQALIAVLLLLHAYSVSAQLSVKAEVGLSYIEHLSTGITFTFAGKHDVSLLYGSNVFIKPQNFSSFLIQYVYTLAHARIWKFTPAVGIKGGHSIYTDTYYRWIVVPIIPFARLGYPLNERMRLFTDAGITISLEQEVTRMNYGEIGKYRELLPEIKAGLQYSLKGK